MPMKQLFWNFIEFCNAQHHKIMSMKAFSLIVKPFIQERKSHDVLLKCYSKEILEQSLRSYL